MRLRPRHTLWPIALFVAVLGLLALARESPVGPVREAADRLLSPLEDLVADLRSFGSLKERNRE
ncbi:MAG: hypothetical protein ABIH26_04455, partial [Candidatus Eisenbacteria bacterium]